MYTDWGYMYVVSSIDRVTLSFKVLKAVFKNLKSFSGLQGNKFLNKLDMLYDNREQIKVIVARTAVFSTNFILKLHSKLCVEPVFN